jgi:hypothetical protein
MTGNLPYPPGFGSRAPGGTPLPPPGGAGYPPAATPQLGSRGVGRYSSLMGAGVVVAVLLATAALVVSLVNAGRDPLHVAPPEAPGAEPAQLLNDEADRAFCLAIGPLMKESTETKNAYQRSGPPGTPERNAAMPGFVDDTNGWARRAQDVLNDHADPPRYLTRVVQRYIDDMLLYVQNISPDRGPDPLDSPTWEQGVIDFAGAVGTCGGLGVGWWN